MNSCTARAIPTDSFTTYFLSNPCQQQPTLTVPRGPHGNWTWASNVPPQKFRPIASQVPPTHSQGFSGKWSSLPNQLSNQLSGQLLGKLWGKLTAVAWDPAIWLVYDKGTNSALHWRRTVDGKAGDVSNWIFKWIKREAYPRIVAKVEVRILNISLSLVGDVLERCDWNWMVRSVWWFLFAVLGRDHALYTWQFGSYSTDRQFLMWASPEAGVIQCNKIPE